MAGNFIRYDVYFLITCGVFCLFMAAFSFMIRFHSLNRKKALLRLEISVGLLLIFDAMTYIFKGDTSTAGMAMTRISNFLTYALNLANLYFLDQFITSAFMETGRFEKLPRHLLICYIVPSVGLTFLIISQFTGLYYYFDENNRYTRGPLYFLGYIFPLICMILLFTFVIQYRNYISHRLIWTFCLFIVLPFAGAIANYFIIGHSLVSYSLFLAAVILFSGALIDQSIELSKAANTESATGLPNTYGYLYEVDKVIHYSDITAYNGYYFDIVRMSQFNNKYSKSIGDEIILKYAAAVRNSIDDDEILGRLGGNFFVALIKKTNTEKFLQLLSDVPVDIKFDGKIEHLHIAAVAGGYEIKDKNIAAGQIIGNTSAAVTYAKNIAHKPYVFFDDELEAKFNHTRQLEENARKGLALEEFEPFYQPKVNSETGSLCGAEALIRWRRNGKLISPAEFIPVMEKNSSICDLDMYNLEHVCRDMRGWLDQGLSPVTVSVNFSRRNLGNQQLADNIKDMIMKYSIPVELIQVEVTETLDEYPMSVLVGFVDRLHEYGISVAIDDFGTGSSSISLLREVHFDVLKIDKTFVDYKNVTEKVILRDIISLSKDINIDCIAEGVEQPDRVEELKAMGCSAIQGFVYARPMEKSDYEKYLKSPQDF